jgi:predicted NUDIX family NTP pyrophosphohydrolase
LTESAGLLIYRRTATELEVLLVHPGGPFWANKEKGAWSIPKGELAEGEDPLAAALREVAEETGTAFAGRGATPLGSVRQRGGKTVHAWAIEGDLNSDEIRSNTFSIEWPPRSGRMAEFPEVDRAAWFNLEAARVKVNSAQTAFLDRLPQLAVG